ncbi:MULTISPECIES: ABC transporter substrate-binding protein [unclassified Nocardioides]|uniref:ABC transporter substrate-binding protein n=1 Tax=unclassified Nocardioides TaxID=2615069 RepID=UPI000056F30D|nr:MULTISPECIES: ABC transporter substrate-binding protein [unclassified Nocardioides]ABL79763.1 amino acid/amide ABC transporter substrate-binding protein, HAAT family [Nocardioides sp. JS614]
MSVLPSTRRGPRARSTSRSVRRSVALGAALALALSLSACGEDKPEVSAAETQAQAADLVDLLAIPEGTDLGGDLTWKMGAALTLSGPSAANGESMKNAIDLAVEQVKAAGGPTIEVLTKDIKGPDPVAAKQAAEELAAAGVPAKITSMGDGLGAMLENTAKDQILSLDGVGGAQVFTQGVDYFFGTREVAPSDAVPGALEWLKQSDPEATTVGLVGVDLGPFNDPIKADITAKIDASGLQFNGLWETVAPTSQDYASVISKIKENQPDMLLVAFGGGAPGAFAAQAKAAGLDSLLMGIEFTEEAVKASKGVLDSDGFHFAMDYFDAENPANPLAELFVDSYEKAYGVKPDFYAANAYEEVLMFWDLVRRVVADGGDPNDSAALKAALEADPTFASVYGAGEGDGPGTLAIDLKTHGVASRPMGVYEYQDGAVSTLATFDVNAAGFALN